MLHEALFDDGVEVDLADTVIVADEGRVEGEHHLLMLHRTIVATDVIHQFRQSSLVFHI